MKAKLNTISHGRRRSGKKSAKNELCLKIELVPEPLWGKNLRNDSALGNYKWRKLRQSVIDERGSACVICGSSEGPHGHEVWEYSESMRSGIAKLLRIEIVCRMCHHVHHYGQTTRLLAEDRLSARDIESVIMHFIRVNGCTRNDFHEHGDEALEQWEQRSTKKWSIEYGLYADLVRRVQEARKNRGRS